MEILETSLFHKASLRQVRNQPLVRQIAVNQARRAGPQSVHNGAAVLARLFDIDTLGGFILLQIFIAMTLLFSPTVMIFHPCQPLVTTPTLSFPFY
ncbi:hypothetical protein AGQ45_24470 [Salmonella enterica subsp. enterica]|nr:hypothetical protein AGQ45_24470 [Salmonella enterica subsp. enterica]